MDFSKKIKVADGVTVTIKGNLDKMKFDYNIKSSNGAYFVKLNGNFNLNTTIAFMLLIIAMHLQRLRYPTAVSL